MMAEIWKAERAVQRLALHRWRMKKKVSNTQHTQTKEAAN